MESFKQVIISEKGRISLPKDGTLDWLSSVKWSARKHMHVGNPEQTQQVIFTHSFVQMYMQQQWVKKRRSQILERDVGTGEVRRRKDRAETM